MNFIRGLLLDGSGSAIDSGSSMAGDVAKNAYAAFKRIINTILPVALGVVLLIGTVYAIVLGVNYSKAEDAEKRKKAREHLVGAIVGFGITLVIIAVIYGVLSLSIFENIFKN